ncbi:MAG: hypothetical protein J7L61_03360 [Thermoplasmata archaeon]|nr:hypothetical protein [Thermoplasmata archaeon]
MAPQQKCPACFGTGIDRLRSGFVKVPCPKCNGTGYIDSGTSSNVFEGARIEGKRGCSAGGVSGRGEGEKR